MKGRTLRFINFLIDTAIYFFLLIIFLLIFRDAIPKESVKWIAIVFYFLYYFILEYFVGQTIGKLITKSKVITLSDNKNYFLIQIVGRTLIRFIPFDMLSYIFVSRGLHDIISKTDVIKLEKQL
jgi:uncharacterized RDD family membrane protein YckC